MSGYDKYDDPLISIIQLTRILVQDIESIKYQGPQTN